MRAKALLSALVLTALVVALLPSDALADESRLRANLTGYQEVPSVASPGQGEFRATIDDENRVINYSLTLRGPFNGALLFAHIHFSQRATNGGVVAFLCGPGGPRTLPACPPNGTVTGEIRPSDIIGPAAQGIAPMDWDDFVRALRAGVTYANVHSSTQGGGEIRGQINDRDQRNDDRADSDDDND